MQTNIYNQPPPSPNPRPAGSSPAPWEETYLDTLADTGQKAKAASAAGISLRHVARHRHEDPKFARLELEAMEAAFDLFESEAIRRAVEGVEVSRQGRNGEVITRTIYSDTLLLKILQRYVWSQPPQKASTNPTNHTFPTAAARRAERDRIMAEVAAAQKRHLQHTAPTNFHPSKRPPP